MEQPLAAGVPYDPRRRTVFGQMDNHTAPDAPVKEKRTKGYVKFRELPGPNFRSVTSRTCMTLR